MLTCIRKRSAGKSSAIPRKARCWRRDGRPNWAPKLWGDKTWVEHSEIPFDSDRKRSTVVESERWQQAGASLLNNGATSVVLERCTQIRTLDGVRPITEEDRKRIQAQTTLLAGAVRCAC